MADLTLSDIERLGAFDEAERTFQMDEEAFRAFYELTARPLWLYLAKVTGDRRMADDHWRAHRAAEELPADVLAGEPDADSRAAARIDLTRAFERLRPRDRSLLWLAYAQGWSHEEIAASLGLKTTSLKAMLHRARGRLMALLVGPRKRGRS